MKDHRNLAFGEIPICWMQRGVQATITTEVEDGSISCQVVFQTLRHSPRIDFLWTGAEWSVVLSTNTRDFPHFITPRTGRLGVLQDKVVVWLGHNCYFHGEEAFLDEVHYLKGLRKH